MKVKQYMVTVYAVLVKNGKRQIEELPEAYIVPVAEYLATQEEGTGTVTELDGQRGKKRPRKEGLKTSLFWASKRARPFA